jgi:putative intracellular protease/amidase
VQSERARRGSCYKRIAKGDRDMPGKRILFVLTSHDKKGEQPSGFYLAEATHPHKVLTEAGHSVEFVSPKGGRAPMDGFDLEDPINAAFYNDPVLRGAVENTRQPSDINPDAYAAIFYVGGHAAMWDLPDNTALAGIAARIYERGGVVAAVCHGPAGLLNVKLANGQYLLAGKQVAGFTNDEEREVKLDGVVPFFLADKLEERGAKHVAAPVFQKQVVVSERLVTGQNPASATGVGEAILGLLDK